MNTEFCTVERAGHLTIVTLARPEVRMKGSLGRIRTAPISSRTRATMGPEGPAEPGVVMVNPSPKKVGRF